MATDAERIRRAAARYGHTLDPIAARYTDPLTGKRLSGEALILKTVEGESRALSNPAGARKAKSSAGALGWAQFMPATRAGVIAKYGVDPWRSPEEAVHALTLHMRGKLGNRTGLEGYNPGDSSYPSYILGQRVGSTRGRARGGGGGGPAPRTSGGGGGSRGAQGPGFTTRPGTPATAGAAPSAASGFSPGGLAQGLQSLRLEPPPMVSTAGPAMPEQLMPKHYTPVPSMGPPQPPPELDLTAPAGQDVTFGGDRTPSPVTAAGPDIVVPGSATPASSGSPGGGGSASSGARVNGFKAGRPTIGGTVGGAHETAGLAGYPARDYFAKPGAPAVAPVNGKVVRLSGHDPKNGPTNGPHGPLGWSVYIQGEDGREYFLTHMGSRTVKPGQRVRAGQRIGTVANYDKYGTPSHIHMGVHG